MTVHAPSSSTSPPASASAHAVGLAPVKKKRKPRRWLRTRDREHLQLLNLQLDINSLYSEIQALQVTRALLAARALQARDADDGSYVRTVHEYFSQLRHGYADPAGPSALAPHMRTARSFLYSIFDADVAKGHLRGIALCIQMIALYTAAFGPVVHELLEARIHVNPNEDADDQLTPGHNGTVLVRAHTRYATTIVPQTFAIIFPRAPLALRERLMGRPLEGNGQFDIVFDAVSHRVVRFDMEFDFLPAFAKLLPHPRDLAQLFQGALVATDCCIGDEAASAAPPLEIGDDSAANSTDEDARSCSTSASSSPVRANSSPVRSMAIHSILNDDDESDAKL